MATIDAGSLAGRVYVAEVSSIRQLAFAAAGAVDDLGLFALGPGTENIPGAIGVSPSHAIPIKPGR
jgi:hypothetical protein